MVPQVGARQRERRDRRAGAPSDRDARPRRQRRHAADGVQAEVLVVHSFEELERRPPRVRGTHRALQRAVHQLRRDGALPCRRAVARRAASARSRCWCAPSARAGLRTPHTGALHLRRRRAEDSGGGDHHRGRRSPAAHGRSRRPRRRPPEDGGALRRRRRSRPTSSARSAAARSPTKSSWSAATSTRGTSAPARPTTAAAAW